MRLRDLLPSLVFSLLSVAVLCGGRFFPSGDGPVLARLGEAGIEGFLSNPALASVALVDAPAQGFVVLRGNTDLIRSALGRIVAWKGPASCSPNS